MTHRLRVWKGDKEISEDVTTANGRAGWSGWSSHELVYIAKDATGHPSAHEHVGWLVSGYPCDCADGYRVEVDPVQDEPRVVG